MKNFLKEITALKFTPWYRWHPKIVLRYLPVVEWMQRKFKVQCSKFKVDYLKGLPGDSSGAAKILTVGSLLKKLLPP